MTTATRDKKGRPLIAVTGIGVVTSLGIGAADNWAKLTGGISGIRRVSQVNKGLAAPAVLIHSPTTAGSCVIIPWVTRSK